MTRGRARRYLLTKQGYYPGVVAKNYDVWDWSTLNEGTLFQDSAKTTPAVANGDPVGCWVDGVKRTDATQVTTAVKPGLALNSLDGLPTLSFDGGDLLATANISISTFALWIVINTAGGTRIIYEHSPNVSSNDGAVQFTTSASPVYVKRSNVYSSKNVTSLSTFTWTLLRHEHTGIHATHKIFYDNVDVTSAGPNANDIGTGTATQPLFIGARSGVVNPLIGNIAQLTIVSPYPTADIRANMENYINNLWNGVY